VDQLLLLLFKITLMADLAGIIAFIVIYSVVAPWWSNVIGRTIVAKDILLGLALTPSILSLFFHFNRLSSVIAGWVDLGLFAGIAVVMIWRCVIWLRIHREENKVTTQEEGS
jgi:hypothetical protein